MRTRGQSVDEVLLIIGTGADVTVITGLTYTVGVVPVVIAAICGSLVDTVRDRSWQQRAEPSAHTKSARTVQRPRQLFSQRDPRFIWPHDQRLDPKAPKRSHFFCFSRRTLGHANARQ